MRVLPAGESGYHVTIEDGDTTLIDRNDTLSASECRMLFVLLQRPGLPDIRFVREASWLEEGRQHSFSCHFLTRDEQVDFGRSPYFASDAEVVALIQRIKSDTSPRTLVGSLPPVPEKPAKKPAKPAKAPAAKKTAKKPARPTRR